MARLDVIILLVLIAVALWCTAVARSQSSDTYYRVYLPTVRSDTPCIIRDAWTGICYKWPYITKL